MPTTLMEIQTEHLTKKRCAQIVKVLVKNALDKYRIDRTLSRMSYREIYKSCVRKLVNVYETRDEIVKKRVKKEIIAHLVKLKKKSERAL